MHDLDDLTLIKRAQSGNLDAVAVLYDRYRPSIFRYLRFRVGHLQTAQDLTGEVFLRMVDHLDHFEDRGVPFSAWLYKIARNLMIKEGVQSNQVQEMDWEAAAVHGSWAENPAVQVEQQLTLEQVADALAQIDALQREVILLRFIVGLSIKETAAALDETIGTVKTWQRRGLHALQAVLAWGELAIVNHE